MKYANSPQVLKENRVERLYSGGIYLDQWQNIAGDGDSFQSEEFIVSTIPYIGRGHPKNQGISFADCCGQEVSLSEMIHSEENDFLGKNYAGKTNGHLGVLARVGDTSQRLIIQCHPTDTYAREHLHSQFGKTEAWYILNLRTPEGCCYAGLKKGITKQAFLTAFQLGDSESMINMLHRITIHKGDMILIPSGMLHAMGDNSTFVEFHQPCDYTLRFESNYSGRHIPPHELDCGLGEKLLLEAVDFTTYTEEEILKTIKIPPSRSTLKQGGTVENLLPFCINPYFRVDRAVIHTSMKFCQSEESHTILIASKGEVHFRKESDGSLINTLSQGRGAVIPSMSGSFLIEGHNSELLIGYPYEAKKGGAYGLFI